MEIIPVRYAAPIESIIFTRGAKSMFGFPMLGVIYPSISCFVYIVPTTILNELKSINTKTAIK